MKMITQSKSVSARQKSLLSAEGLHSHVKSSLQEHKAAPLFTPNTDGPCASLEWSGLGLTCLWGSLLIVMRLISKVQLLRTGCNLGQIF